MVIKSLLLKELSYVESRGLGWGRGRIAAPVEVKVPMPTYGHERTVSPEADVIHGDVQDCVEGDGPLH